MTDLISRQAAIDSIEKHLRLGDELYPLTDTDKILNHGFEIAASCIYNLPSAHPERKRGRWIGGEIGRCSVCGHEGCASDIWNNCERNFCPNCGADMRGEK